MLVRVRKLARVSVCGVVQGVGFRPFVYRLARDYKLDGWVRNTSGKVEIEVEGDESSLYKFVADLEVKAPPMARIEHVEASYHAPAGLNGFTITGSRAEAGQYQLVSPDIATCPDCLREIFDPADRRYRYPFTNCTNCGPRFTIIEDIPYDRPLTTMREFRMCPRCQREYDDPLDRRFHAQPNACSECGPRLTLTDGNGVAIEAGDIIGETARLLGEGKIVAVRGLGGFQLACDATNSETVDLLRKRKRRPAKPFAVMMAAPEDIGRHCLISPEEAELLGSSQAPIVLLNWKRELSNIVPGVASGLNYLGVMLPYTPLHHILMRDVGIPLVMTSGNLSEEPIAKDNDEALRRLKGIADYFLLHNRGIYARYDDSVYLVEKGEARSLRRARSYAPYPIFLPFKAKQILACGAEEKNTFCLTKDDHAFLSQHIGDLENLETLEHYENTIGLYQRLFRVEPEIVAYDMHPEYLSTKYALEVGAKRGLKLVPVQHHHAHIVSCTAENGVKEPVIGVAFDGTGYGPDGTIWGGEFLVADWRGFQRAGYLEPVPLPGGASAIRKPYRMALGYIFALLGEEFDLDGLPITAEPVELDIIRQQVKNRINSPLTSSAGRLFDAVSALCGVRREISYEAQAAIELEMLAAGDAEKTPAYPFATIGHNGEKVVKLDRVISSVAGDVRNRVPVPEISLRFHRTVAEIIMETSRLLAGETGIRRVALSGGCFQNRLLFRLTAAALKKEGFEVLTQRLVPCNDGGISLGQAVIASFEG